MSAARTGTKRQRQAHSRSIAVPATYDHYDIEGARRRLALRALLKRIGAEVPASDYYNETALHDLYEQHAGLRIDDQSLLQVYEERWTRK